MYRPIRSAAVGVLLVACADVRVGMQRYPIGSVDSDGAVLQAVKHALPPDEQTCPLNLLTAGDARKAAESTGKQIVSVEICGRSQRFSIQRSQVNADTVLVTARKI
jgi:hypothetical protein